MEASKLINAEFKMLAVRMLNDPSENFNKDWKHENGYREHKNKMKNTIIEIKNIY